MFILHSFVNYASDLFNLSAISSCTTDCTSSLCEWIFSLKFLQFNWIFFPC